MMLVFFSCRKDASDETANDSKFNDQVISKVKLWLEEQKAHMFEFKAANIDLLKENLEYSNLNIEVSGNNEKIIIIPINENFKQKRITDKNSIPNLVLIMSTSGDIRKGNVVLFKPKNNGTYSKVPKNTFYNIFNTAFVNCDGQFQFLSIAGKLQYQLEFEQGKLASASSLKNEEKKIDTRLNSICINWCLVTTYYVDGIPVYQTSEYVGTTCSDDCYNPDYMSLCPDGGGGGGNEEDVWDTDAESAIMSQVYSTNTESASQDVSFSTQEPDESQVSFTWVIVRNSFNLWQVRSSDIAIGYNSTNTGAIIYDIQHVSSGISGQTFWCRVPTNPGGPCIPLINLSWQETSSSKSIASNYKSGTVTVSGQLKNLGIPIKSATQSCTVRV